MDRFDASTLFRRVGAGAVLAVGRVLAGGARADPPLWKVDGPGAKVELFGSIHLLSGATHWRTPAFDAELAKADALWFEIPLGAGSQSQAAQLVQAKGVLAAPQTLSALLPPALDVRVKALAAREGLPVPARAGGPQPPLRRTHRAAAAHRPGPRVRRGGGRAPGRTRRGAGAAAPRRLRGGGAVSPAAP